MLRYIHDETARRVWNALPIRVQFKLCVAGYEEKVRIALSTLLAAQYHAAVLSDVMERLLLVCLMYSQDKYNSQQAINNLYIPLPDPRKGWMKVSGLAQEDFAEIEKAMIASGYVIEKETL